MSKVQAPTAIGKLIQESRENADPKVSQRKLSTELGYGNGQFISNVERGICKIPLDKINKVAEVLSISTDVIKDALLEDYGFTIDKAINSAPIGGSNESTNSISI